LIREKRAPTQGVLEKYDENNYIVLEMLNLRHTP
jgi:hypothetical protein